MNAFDILTSLVELSPKLEIKEYQPIPEAPDLPEIKPLQETLALIGADVQCYMMSGGESGNYLCRPALQKDKDGCVVLFFSPDHVFKIPTSSVLIGGNSLVMASKTTPIPVRKIDGVQGFLDYDGLKEVVSAGKSRIISLTNLILDYDLEGEVLEFDDIQAKPSTKVGTVYTAEIWYNGEMRKVFLDQKVYNNLSFIEVTKQSRTFIANLTTYKRKDGATGYKVSISVA